MAWRKAREGTWGQRAARLVWGNSLAAGLGTRGSAWERPVVPRPPGARGERSTSASRWREVLARECSLRSAPAAGWGTKSGRRSAGEPAAVSGSRWERNSEEQAAGPSSKVRRRGSPNAERWAKGGSARVSGSETAERVSEVSGPRSARALSRQSGLKRELEERQQQPEWAPRFVQSARVFLRRSAWETGTDEQEGEPASAPRSAAPGSALPSGPQPHAVRR